MTRRVFLGAATSTIVASLPFKRRWSGRATAEAVSAGMSPVDVVLLDLGENCGLRESFAGYEAALCDAGLRYNKVAAGALPQCRVLIVPGCVVILDEVARNLSTQLSDGAAVLVESGGGFSETAKFNAHRNFLETHLGIRVEPPLSLWADAEGEGHSPTLGEAALPHRVARVPFVDYTWPRRTKVRDFSRVIPLKEPAGKIIAVSDGKPVASLRKVGKGTLIFLGSPLGPALLAGDREARAWLRDSISAA